LPPPLHMFRENLLMNILTRIARIRILQWMFMGDRLCC